MLVSIIIPVYNVAPYVEQCILSVIDQTYKNLEVIIVDDCGTDESMDIVERVIQENGYRSAQNCYRSATYRSFSISSSFKILHHEHNRGLSAARNTGIDAATGDYLYFLDSDDWISPECIQLMVEALKGHPDSEIVFAGANVTTGEHQWLDYTKKTLTEYSNDRDWLQLSMLKRYDLGMTAWNKLILRDFVIKNKLYFEEGMIHEDEVWNFLLSRHLRTASFLHKNTYIYNIRSQSITTTSNEDIRWQRLFAIWEKMSSLISGYRTGLQVKAVCSFIFEKTRKSFPDNYKRALFMIFIKMGIKIHNHLSPYLFSEGLIALCYPKKFHNTRICSKIKL